MIAPRVALAVLTLLLAGTRPAPADSFRPDGRYDSAVPPPAAVLGFEPGERPARYEEAARYAEALAAASSRARLFRYARSHEGRDLLLIVISAPRHLERLEEIREEIGRLADPRQPIRGAGLSGLVEKTPAIAYMAYGIHGDELSSTDAALRLAYELAAGQTEDVTRLLENLIVLVDPMENPDGRERILSMTTAYQGLVPSPDPDGLSHAGFWPWGRGNHYLFDLNRDWFAQVHPESRGRADVLRTWRPQLVVDSHEMGYESTYLFNPPRDPFNPYLPSSTPEWWRRFSADQAKAFDRRGWSYYTREWADEFYPGYGSSIALYQGAVGILYEQSATDGQPVRKPSGRIERYRDAVEHHFTSSLVNLGTAAAHRAELLRAYRAARAEAIARGRGSVRAFYFSARPHPDRAARLASRLARLGIEVDRLESDGAIPGARSPWDGAARTARLEAGSYRVRLDQPDGLLARAVLESHIQMPDSTLAREREHLERQKGTRLYDVTAWSPLLGYGLETWWTSGSDGLRWRRLEPGAEVVRDRPAGIAPGAAPYGWLWDGTTDAALVLASELATRGAAVRAGQERFRFEGRALPRGCFLARAEENDSTLADTLDALARRLEVEVLPIPSARITDGPDLGGDLWPLLRGARIAILAGPALDFTSVGWAWNLLDAELRVRASLLDVVRVASAGLSRYNVIVLPRASEGAEGYRRALGPAGVEALRSWTESGGTLIGIGTGAEFIADDSTRLSGVKLRSQAVQDFAAPRFGLPDSVVRAVERMQAMGLGADGTGSAYAGPYEEFDRRTILAIPGPGSPLLGPGARAAMGLPAAGSARALREPAGPPGEGPGDEERKRQRKQADDRLKRFLPTGAIVRVDLDPEHWLAHGCGTRVAVMASEPEAFLARDPVATVGRFAGPSELHLGGVLWPEAAGRMAHTAWLTRERVGRGQIVLFATDPNFRGYFLGSERLFLNATLLGPGLGTVHPVSW